MTCLSEACPAAYAGTVGEDDRGSTVAILAAHPRSSAMLWSASTSSAEVREVPVVHLNSRPEVADLATSLDEMFGCTVTLLRLNEVRWDQDFNPTALIAEIALPSTGLPEGFAWTPVGPTDLTTVEPAWVRPSLASWVEQRDGGWSPLRPAWSRPGWFDGAAEWMVTRMKDAGYRAPQRPRVRHLWGLSIVLSAESQDGTAFLKCSTGLFRHEAVLTQALADYSPGTVPTVLAVEPDLGWLLMRDFGNRLLGDEPETLWTAGLDLLVQAQRAWAHRTQMLTALGAPNRPLDDLADWVAESPHDQTLMSRLEPAFRSDWCAATHVLSVSCRRLAQLGPDPTLVNSDFHPWNVAVTDSGAVLFDWNDPAIAHPFLDLATYVLRTDNLDMRRHLVDHYLASWDTQLTQRDLEQAGSLALIVGCLYQVRMYRDLLPTLMPEDQGPLADGDQHWMARALRTFDHGIHMTY
jgi:hypothetical protein